MDKEQSYVSPKRKKFNDEHEGLSDSELLREHLWTQRLIYERAEKVRANTSTLVWFLIVIPIIIVVLFGFMGASI